MINRIREIRQAREMTLAELASACDPPTTAQTIGRLETGTRNLSIKWMDRIGRALGIDPGQLVRSEALDRPRVIAELGLTEIEALASAREAVLPHEIATQGANDAADGLDPFVVISVIAAISEYRSGDSIWLRRIPSSAGAGALRSAINRDCLIPRSGGRFAFGRLIDVVPGGPPDSRDGNSSFRFGILPVQSGQKQQIIDAPEWIAVAEMLVRRL